MDSQCGVAEIIPRAHCGWILVVVLGRPVARHSLNEPHIYPGDYFLSRRHWDVPDVVRCNGAMGHNVGPGEPRFDMEFVENLAFRELFFKDRKRVRDVRRCARLLIVLLPVLH